MAIISYVLSKYNQTWHSARSWVGILLTNFENALWLTQEFEEQEKRKRNKQRFSLAK